MAAAVARQGERQSLAVTPNVLGRKLEASAANRKWIAGFTLLGQQRRGWLYVAVVIVGVSSADR